MRICLPLVLSPQETSFMILGSSVISNMYSQFWDCHGSLAMHAEHKPSGIAGLNKLCSVKSVPSEPDQHAL